MTVAFQPGDVCIETRNRGSNYLRAVIIVECPEHARDWWKRYENDAGARIWGMYLEKDGWGGPWHGPISELAPHPDPDSIWPKWAEYCAERLTNA